MYGYPTHDAFKEAEKEISSLVAVKFLSVAVNQIDSARIVKQNGV